MHPVARDFIARIVQENFGAKAFVIPDMLERSSKLPLSFLPLRSPALMNIQRMANSRSPTLWWTWRSRYHRAASVTSLHWLFSKHQASPWFGPESRSQYEVARLAGAYCRHSLLRTEEAASRHDPWRLYRRAGDCKQSSLSAPSATDSGCLRFIAEQASRGARPQDGMKADGTLQGRALGSSDRPSCQWASFCLELLPPNPVREHCYCQFRASCTTHVACTRYLFAHRSVQ